MYHYLVSLNLMLTYVILCRSLFCSDVAIVSVSDKVFTKSVRIMVLSQVKFKINT